MNDFYYLSHGGPGSGRYPLGSGERPYQKFEGSRRKSKGISGYIAEKKKERQRAEEIKRKNQQEILNQNKERVLKSGKASEVIKYKGTLTNDELRNVYKRLQLEKQISDMSSTELLDNQQMVNKVINNIKKTADWVVTGAISYNTLASVYNSMVDDSKKLPTLKISR